MFSISFFYNFICVISYGAPGFQQVKERYALGWGNRLASSLGIVYAFIDGRGSGYRGEDILRQVYRRLGTVEVEDQIQVTK